VRKPLMLITEFLRGVSKIFLYKHILNHTSLNSSINFTFLNLLQGDLHQYLKEKGALSPSVAVNFALDIARYLLCFAYPGAVVCNVLVEII
jgi:hypothetical protein